MTIKQEQSIPFIQLALINKSPDDLRKIFKDDTKKDISSSLLDFD